MHTQKVADEKGWSARRRFDSAWLAANLPGECAKSEESDIIIAFRSRRVKPRFRETRDTENRACNDPIQSVPYVQSPEFPRLGASRLMNFVN